MKKLSGLVLIIFASSLLAQVQLGKNVQIGFGSGQGSGTVNAGTAGQFAQYPANGTAVQGSTVSGDCSLANGGAITCTKTNGNPFAASATTDTTNASNITSGTLNSSRLPSIFAGANGIVFNTSTTASRNATFSDIVPLWQSGTCSGYLKSDGTCSTPSSFPSTSGIVFNTSTTASRNAAFSDIVPLWGSGSCSGYLKSDGTCDIPSSGGSSVGPAGTLQVAGVSAGSFGAATSLYLAPNEMFGDSTMFDWGADLYPNSWAGLLTNAHGGPTYNGGVLGALSTDGVINVANTLNPNANTAVPQYVGLINYGINDAATCGGTTTACQQNFTAAESAAIALFELTGSTYQTLAPACTLTGSWTADTTNFTNYYKGEVSTTNGNSFSCSITTTGNPIALEAVVHNSDAGTANCRVDSGTYQNVNFFPYIAISNGSISIFRTEIAAAAGSHTLNCVITSATSASNPVEFIGIDSFPVGTASTLPYLTVTNVTPNAGVNDANSAAISALVPGIVSGFQAEGGNLVMADIRTPMLVPAYFAANNPNCPQLFAGNVHYNDCGHRVVYNAIQAASPMIYQTNIAPRSYGDSTFPFRSIGRYIPSMTNGSALSTGNSNNLGPNSGYIAPGGWCVINNQCFSIGGANGQIIPPDSGASEVLRINAYHNICFSFNTASTQTESQFNHYPFCGNSNGDLYNYFANGGTPIIGIFHPGLLSHDNTTAVSGTSGPSLITKHDVTFVGPLTANVNAVMGGCDPGSPNLTNFEYTLFRHGNDGFTVTFTSTSPDNINGGSAGNSYVWSANEGQELKILCSQNAVGGSSWNITAIGASSTPQLTSFVGSGTASYTLGGSAQVGTGASAPTCSAGYACNSLGGQVQFTTGTGTLAAGTIFTINPGVTRSVNPSCTVNINSATYTGINALSNTTSISINVAAALSASTTYTVTWGSCQGN